MQKTADILAKNHEVLVVHPGLFENYKCPFSPDIRLAVGIKDSFIKKLLKPPCAVHIVAEGTIGFAFRNYCARHKIPFTTAYHTNYPEYLWEHAWIPQFASRIFFRWFHRDSKAIMVATPSLQKKIVKMGFKCPPKLWGRGVDTSLFHPREKTISFPGKKIGLYVGRVSKEKNLERFLELKIDGMVKYVTGPGEPSYVNHLAKRFPDAIFTGPLTGEELGQMYCNCDVFVFPSKSDTFGLVVIEALACGKPVAAYPVEGPVDIIGGIPNVGCCDDNLRVAIDTALNTHSAQACQDLAAKYTWEACTESFVSNLAIYN
jgi:glycosyltransferase involved in cell wall biosynthesis